MKEWTRTIPLVTSRKCFWDRGTMMSIAIEVMLRILEFGALL